MNKFVNSNNIVKVGKYQGKNINEVKVDYLIWALSKFQLTDAEISIIISAIKLAAWEAVNSNPHFVNE